jgi:hypothetical protein
MRSCHHGIVRPWDAGIVHRGASCTPVLLAARSCQAPLRPLTQATLMRVALSRSARPRANAAHVQLRRLLWRTHVLTRTLLAAFTKLPASGRAQLTSFTSAATDKYKVKAARLPAALRGSVSVHFIAIAQFASVKDSTTSVSTARHHATVSDVARSPAARTKAARTRHHSQNTHYTGCVRRGR